jgi:hypothetical protein
MLTARFRAEAAAFDQVDDSWSRKYDGAGLGLPISRALTQLHGGTLELMSERNAGTPVTVRLPPERVGPAPSASLQAADVPPSAESTIPAADEAASQQAMRRGTG